MCFHFSRHATFLWSRKWLNLQLPKRLCRDECATFCRVCVRVHVKHFLNKRKISPKIMSFLWKWSKRKQQEIRPFPTNNVCKMCHLFHWNEFTHTQKLRKSHLELYLNCILNDFNYFGPAMALTHPFDLIYIWNVHVYKIACMMNKLYTNMFETLII